MYVNFVAIWIIVAAEKDEARPNKKLEGRFIITEVGPDGEPIAPEAAAKKFIRQSDVLSGTTSRSASGSGNLPIQARNGMRYPKEKKMVLAGA